MKELVKCFAKAMHMPVWTFVPEFAVRLFLGEMGETIILSSQRVVPQKLLDLGFQFSYPTLHEAVGELVRKERISL
jgi:NAD dependent epimerase/dehydratase family enzyme